MRKQRFFTLITAAVLTLTAVPALPASAAAPSFAGKISAAADGPFFSPGFDWEKYSTMNCAVTNPALNQERSQCGLLVHLSQPDTDLFLVTRYTDWRPATENRKAGQIRINTRAYDVYSYPPGTSSLQSDDKTREYWCVPMTSPDDAESTVRFQLDEILEQLTQLGLPAGKLEEIKPFAIFPDNHNNYSVDTPSDSKVTADFQVKTPSKDNVRLKYGSTDNEFSWELYQAPESGTHRAGITALPLNGQRSKPASGRCSMSASSSILMISMRATADSPAPTRRRPISPPVRRRSELRFS